MGISCGENCNCLYLYYFALMSSIPHCHLSSPLLSLPHFPLAAGKGNPAIVEDFVVRPKNEGQRLADQDKRAVVESFDKSLKGQ